jgi:hypothetical protein
VFFDGLRLLPAFCEAFRRSDVAWQLDAGFRQVAKEFPHQQRTNSMLVFCSS